MRVAAGLDVWIDAKGGAGARRFRRDGFGSESVELGFGFDIEEKDAGVEGFADFFFGLFPTPEKTIRWPGTPMWRKRWSSPPETMSKLLPCDG